MHKYRYKLAKMLRDGCTVTVAPDSIRIIVDCNTQQVYPESSVEEEPRAAVK